MNPFSRPRGSNAESKKAPRKALLEMNPRASPLKSLHEVDNHCNCSDHHSRSDVDKHYTAFLNAALKIRPSAISYPHASKQWTLNTLRGEGPDTGESIRTRFPCVVSGPCVHTLQTSDLLPEFREHLCSVSLLTLDITWRIRNRASQSISDSHQSH